MYLTYLDDGGKGGVKIFGGIILPHQQFVTVEAMSGLIAVSLVPPERRADFEFHASDLFAGTKDFVGIAEAKRLDALRQLVRLPKIFGATYVYSAIDMQKLQRGPARSARWVDVAFFMCACAVDGVISSDAKQSFSQWQASAPDKKIPPPPDVRPLNLMVVDDPEQEGDRKRIRATFRELRGTLPQVMKQTDEEGNAYSWSNRLTVSVDDVFFGSSSDSIGLQIADVCNWVMWRRLADNIADDYYNDLMSGRVMCAMPEPDWTEFRHLFKTHGS